MCSSHDSILHLSDKSKPEQKRCKKFLKVQLILGALIQQGILWCCMWRTLREINCTIYLVSPLSLFQVCYTRISFLSVQLFDIILFQLHFSFSIVANSVAGFLLRKVELMQFVQETKPLCAAMCISTGSHQTQTLSASPCTYQTAKTTDCAVWRRTAAYLSSMQTPPPWQYFKTRSQYQ